MAISDFEPVDSHGGPFFGGGEFDASITQRRPGAPVMRNHDDRARCLGDGHHFRHECSEAGEIRFTIRGHGHWREFQDAGDGLVSPQDEEVRNDGSRVGKGGPLDAGDTAGERRGRIVIGPREFRNATGSGALPDRGRVHGAIDRIPSVYMQVHEYA